MFLQGLIPWPMKSVENACADLEAQSQSQQDPQPIPKAKQGYQSGAYEKQQLNTSKV